MDTNNVQSSLTLTTLFLCYKRSFLSVSSNSNEVISKGAKSGLYGVYHGLLYPMKLIVVNASYCR